MIRILSACSILIVTSVRAGASVDRYPAERPVRTAPIPAETVVTVYPESVRQTINGLGFEIQSDSIASGNTGLPQSFVGVPHDLTPSERARLSDEMLHGFRYCRLAGGLYWRGLDPSGRYLMPRWPEQLDELADMLHRAHIEGVSMEYWSPAPFWKANRKYTGRDGSTNVLRCFGPKFSDDPDYHGNVDQFLADFAQACKADLQTLKAHGISISFWGLQNEPFTDTPYSSCGYSHADYARTFRAVAPVIRAFDSKIKIIADTGPSWDFPYIRSVLNDPSTASLVDALVIHHVGSDANIVRPPSEPSGKPRFQNEYEYQPWQGPATPDKCLNTVEHIMNWFQLGQAPTWFWIHALKPYTNEEASGYSLGFWRPLGESDDRKFPAGLKPGHWMWNPYNWNAVGSFVKHLPWDSRGVRVDESVFDDDLRVFAFVRPNGKLSVVVANRCSTSHSFHIQSGRANARFRGFRYTPANSGTDCTGVTLDRTEGSDFRTTLPDLSWEFWEEI